VAAETPKYTVLFPDELSVDAAESLAQEARPTMVSEATETTAAPRRNFFMGVSFEREGVGVD